MSKRLYINANYVGNYTDFGDCSIGYSVYRWFKMGDYEIIIPNCDIEASCIGRETDEASAIFTKGGVNRGE